MGCEKPESGDRISVAVRVRPPNDDEQDSVVNVFADDSEIAIGTKRFTFDNVFDVNEPQSAVFEKSFRQIIEGCVDGFNATVLAYGQTGSGKTYSMGTASTSDCTINPDSGIIPRAVELLFSRLNERRNNCDESGESLIDVRVQAQFVELYNEELRDLLDSVKFGKSQVKIHEGARGDIYLTGVSCRVVHSLEDTLRCLRDGSMARTTASTNMNSTSSRSHAIFSLMVQQRWKISTGGFEKRYAKIHFVDLAGSERMKRTGAIGERAREGISINCGLLALGNVISALANLSGTTAVGGVGNQVDSGDGTTKERTRAAHIPYRDSKLTRLLADSLGGNARTLMIACVSPSLIDKMETLNTLQYANRIKKIRNRVTANRQLQAGPAEVTALRERVRDLEAEGAALRERVRDLEADLSERRSSCSCVRRCPPGEREGPSGRLAHLWKEWNDSVLEADAKAAHMKQMTVRCHLRQQVADRSRKLAQLDETEEVAAAMARMEAELLSLNARHQSCEMMHGKSLRRAQMARDRLTRQLREATPRAETERLALHSLLRLGLRQAEHGSRMCRYLLAHTGAFQRLFCSMMDLLRKEHLLLMAHRTITPDLTDQFTDLLKQFEGRKKVCWGDDTEEAGTECSSLSSWTTDSDMADRKEGLPEGVFQLRTPDLTAWLDQCVERLSEAMPPEPETMDITVQPDDPTPKASYNLRPRRSGSYTPAVSSSPLSLTTPVLGPSVLNRTFDFSQHAEPLETSTVVRPQFTVSRVRVNETERCVTPPPSKQPSRALMTTTVTKKRHHQFSDVENVGTPRKMLKTAGGVKWENGLPLPVIASPLAVRRQPMRVLSVVDGHPAPGETRRRMLEKSRQRPAVRCNSSNPASSSYRRLSFIPRMNFQTSQAKRRATLFPSQE